MENPIRNIGGDTMRGKIAASSLNVRKGTSTAYSVVKTLSRGTVINILGNKKVGTTTWYKIKEGWISGKYVTIISNTKNEIIVTPDMGMKQIQSCLKENGCTIRFTKGTYNITKTLLLYSNTTIILDKGVVLIRKNSKQIFINYLNPKMSYNYNATENIKIIGNGILRGNGTTKICSDISIMHCSDFVIEGITFENTYKSHAIDICGCNNITLKNVKFNDRIPNKNKPYKEEINIDYSYYGGFPYYHKGSKCFNNNHCKNITFDGVEFNNVNVCIGNHFDTKRLLKHKDIIIKRCTANGCIVNNEGVFLHISNVDGLKVENNSIKDFARDIVIDSLQDVKIGCSDINIIGNLFMNAKGSVKAAGLYFISQYGAVHKDITITDNKFALNNPNAKYDIYMSYVEDAKIEKNNTKLEIRVDNTTCKNIIIK
jgi:hypothetical protein